MSNTRCRLNIDTQIIDQLWDRINAKFATNQQVIDLAAELKKIEMGINIQTSHAANAAAAMVLKSIQCDLEKVKKMMIEIVPYVDKDGKPIVPGTVNYNTIYLTPAQLPDETDNSLWDEWIALPIEKAIGTKCHGLEYKWERVGNKKIDLSWIKVEFDKVNECICALNHRLTHVSKALARAILKKAVEPINELQKYIKSPEYIAYVFSKLPRAAMGTDGLMTANQFTILSMLAVWAANDHKILGGGALGPDVVIHLLEENGVPADDLKDIYHHHCCICAGE